MITKIQHIEGKAIPLTGDDIDTDRIIPARFMKCLTFDGLGNFAFYDERFDDHGNKKKHPLNSQSYENHSILISNRNFGCGSSREHAPWALSGIGIKCIIAQSYAEIFANNCSSLGIPALVVEEKICRDLQTLVTEDPQCDFEIDLHMKTISAGKKMYQFTMPETYRLALIDGKWDTVSMLMEGLDEVKKKHNELPQFSS